MVRLKSFLCRGMPTLLLFFTMTVACTGCTDDLGVNPNDDKAAWADLPSGTKLYAYIKLLPVDGVPSRADGRYEDNYGDNNNSADFLPGISKESEIDNMLVIFYDKAQEYLTHCEVDKESLKEFYNKKKLENTGLAKDDEENGDNVVVEELGYNVLIPVEFEVTSAMKEKGKEVGSYFVILNYNADLLSSLLVTDPNTQTTSIPMSVLKNFRVTSHQLSQDDNKLGFLMTTAGHFYNGVFQWLDQAPEGNQVIYSTAGMAQQNAVIIYVERLAVKVNFEIDKNNINPIEVLYDETDVYKLIFEPDYWALEATERQSHLPKQLEMEKLEDYNLGGNQYPQDFADWINYNNNRIFWAKSPTFRDGKYPSVTRKKDEKFSLDYLTFDEIMNQGKNLNEETESLLTGTLYSLEHTFYANTNLYETSEFSKAANPYAVPTSVVLCGHYTATFAGTDEKPGKKDANATEKLQNKTLSLVNGFYLRPVDMERTDADSKPQKNYQYHLYLEDDKDTGGELLSAFLAEQYLIWGKTAKGEYYPVRKDSKEAKAFIIQNTYRRLDIIENKEIPASNTYTLQIDNNKINTYDIYLKKSENENDTKKITPNNLVEANRELQKQLGYALKYRKGYAFFYAPIPHYSGASDPFGEKGRPYNGLFNLKDESPGKYIVSHLTSHFGVVRNHIYNMTINSIGSLGYGVPENDIIPLPDPQLEKEQYIFDLQLQILPWKIYEYTFDI